MHVQHQISSQIHSLADYSFTESVADAAPDHEAEVDGKAIEAPSPEAAGAYDESGNYIPPEELARRDEQGRMYLEIWGIEDPRNPKGPKEPYEGQDPKIYRFDASLARLHVVLSAGLGLGVASSVHAVGASALALYEAAITEMLEVLSGGLGVAGYVLGHKRLMEMAYPQERSTKQRPVSTPGYAHGVSQAVYLSIIASGLGFCLYETHAVGCLGSLLVASGILAGLHFLRHRSFTRE